MDHSFPALEGVGGDGDGEHDEAAEEVPGGRKGGDVSHSSPVPSLFVFPCFSLFLSSWIPLSPSVLSLPLHLSPCLVYLTRCAGQGAGNRPLAWGLELGPSEGKIHNWN